MGSICFLGVSLIYAFPLQLNDFTGTPWYILDHQSDFPSEEQVVEIFRKDSRKKVKLLSFLSWSTNGFKCLVLISEV